TRGDGQVSVTWSAPFNGGSAITGYNLEWSSDNGTTWSAPLQSATTSPATSAAVTGLTDGTAYKFRIAAINANGAGSFSAASSAVVPAGAPAAPSGVSATAGDAQATVAWAAPSSNGDPINGYDVRYSANGGESWISADVSFPSSPATITGLANGTPYLFEVA